MTTDNSIHDFMDGVKQLRKLIGLHHFVVGLDAAYLLHVGEPITRKTVVDVFVPHEHWTLASVRDASYGKYKARKKIEYVDGWTFRLTAPFIIPELKWTCPETGLEHSRRLFCFTRGHEVKIVQHLTDVDHPELIAIKRRAVSSLLSVYPKPRTWLTSIALSGHRRVMRKLLACANVKLIRTAHLSLN